VGVWERLRKQPAATPRTFLTDAEQGARTAECSTMMSLGASLSVELREMRYERGCDTYGTRA